MFLYWTYGYYADEILSNTSQDFERMNVIHRYVRLSDRQHNMLPFPRRVAVRKPSYGQIHGAGTARQFPYRMPIKYSNRQK